MTAGIHQVLDRSGIGRALAARINRLGLPWSRWPVRVGGLWMTAHTADRWLALWLWKFGRLERAGMLWMDRVARAGMCAVDVGANTGVYTLQLARSAGPAGRVWSFEPDAGNFNSLQRNVALNKLSNVVCEQRAVGAETGTATLYLDDAHHGNHRVFRSASSSRAVAVQVVALDDYFPPDQRIDVVKIDVQGAESLVLRGMRRILSRSPGLVVFCELSVADPLPEGCSAEDAVQELAALGYSFASLDERSGQLCPAANAAELLARLHAVPYVNVVATAPRS